MHSSALTDCRYMLRLERRWLIGAKYWLLVHKSKSTKAQSQAEAQMRRSSGVFDQTQSLRRSPLTAWSETWEELARPILALDVIGETKHQALLLIVSSSALCVSDPSSVKRYPNRLWHTATKREHSTTIRGAQTQTSHNSSGFEVNKSLLSQSQVQHMESSCQANAGSSRLIGQITFHQNTRRYSLQVLYTLLGNICQYFQPNHLH